MAILNDASTNNKLYHNRYQEIWESRSSIRTRPRKVIDFSKNGFFFPAEKQPILYNRNIVNLGVEVKAKVLLYSFYKYLKDITDLEIKLINTTCYQILFDELAVRYTDQIKLNTLTVMVDEYYHVYIAHDIIMQLKQHYPTILRQDYPVSDAYNALVKTKSELEQRYRDMFQVIAVSIFETTLVKELTELFNCNNIHDSIRDYVNDHINDEAKHYNFFFELMCYTWEQLTDDYRDNIAGKLVDFLIIYFSISSWKEFNYKLLLDITKNQKLSQEIINELYDNFDVTPDMPIVKNVIRTLEKAGIYDNNFFQNAIVKRNWSV
jgi:hypothetical protein